MEKKEIVVAIDIGTTKILTIIAEINREEQSFDIIGHGISLSRGLSKGVVIDVNQTTKDIEDSVRSAEIMAEVANVDSAFIGIAGRHIESLVSHAANIISKNPREILESDKIKLESVAENRVVPIDRKVIHKIVHNYKIDGSEPVKNPVGMTGMKLEADVHIITGVVNAIEALVKSTNNLSIGVDDVVLEPLASAKAVLILSISFAKNNFWLIIQLSFA